MKRTLVVGTGPSGYAVLTSLGCNADIWVMDGQSNFNNQEISTSSHLALKLKFGSSHTYIDSKSLGLLDDSEYKLPISHSRGGFGEIWGNGFTPYEYSELDSDSSSLFQVKVREAMKELLDLIPFSHIPSELDERFGKVCTWSNSTDFGQSDPHSIFNNILNHRKNIKSDGLLFGPPNVMLNGKVCTNCGLCLTGCPYGALFDPGEAINRMVFSKKLDGAKFIKGIVTSIESTLSGVRVNFSNDSQEKSEWFDEVILSTGPLSTAMILMRSGLLPNYIEIPDSQVFYGAFFSAKRFRSLKESKQLGQIVCYPSSFSKEDFQVSFYSPSELSQQRISQKIFPSFMRSAKVPRFISDRVIPVIGFLPQEASGIISLEKTTDGFRIKRIKNSTSRAFAKKSLRKISSSLSQFGLFNFPFVTQIPAPGAGFHIGASLPLGGEYVDSKGYLLNSNSIRIMDASILPKVPAGAHTFVAMALIRALILDEE